MNSTGGRLQNREKAKWENLQDWIKRKMEKHILLLRGWVQDS